jgi:hypothetical protein
MTYTIAPERFDQVRQAHTVYLALQTELIKDLWVAKAAEVQEGSCPQDPVAMCAMLTQFFNEFDQWSLWVTLRLGGGPESGTPPPPTSPPWKR